MHNRQNQEQSSNRGNRRTNGRRFYSNNHQARNEVSANTQHSGVDNHDSTEISPSASNDNNFIPSHSKQTETRGSANKKEICTRRNNENRLLTKDNNLFDRTTSLSKVSALNEHSDCINPPKGGNHENLLVITDRRNLFPNKSDSGDILSCVTSEDVDVFVKSTYFWFYSKPPSSSPVGHGPIPTTLEKPYGTCALYSVTSVSKAKIARLQAITVDLWLPERGDLREIVLTKDSTNTLTGRRYNPKKNLMVGDVILVQRVSPTPFSKENRWGNVTETNPKERNKQDFKHRWSVDEYQLVTRRMYENRLAVAVERLFEKEDDEDVTSLFLAVEGVGEIVRMSALNLSSEFLQKDTVMVGTVFVPPPRAAVFSFNPSDQFNRNLLEQQYNKAGRQKPPRPTFIFSRIASEDERNFLGECRNHIYKELPNSSATEWLHRGFALSIPGIAAFERSKVDTSPYTVVLQIKEKGDDFLRFCFESEEGSWSSGQSIVMKMASGKRSFGRVTYIEQENGNDSNITERERRIWRRNKGYSTNNRIVVHAKAAGIHALTIYRSFSEHVVVRQIPLRVRGSEEEFYCGEELLDLNPDHRFPGAIISVFGGDALHLKPSEISWNNPRKIRYKGGEIVFLEEQMKVLNAVINSDSAVVVSAGFGCGKTLLSNVMLARLAQKYPDKVHAVVVQCNFAVVNAVNCAAALEEYSDQRIVRLISPLNMGLQEEKTKFDLPDLMRDVFQKLRSSEDISDEDFVFVHSYLKEIGETKELPWDELDNLEETDRQQKISEYFQAVRIFFRIYKPQRIFSTTSSLFSFIQNIGLDEKLKEIVHTLIVDEASQLSAATLALLAHRLPGARPVLIGDPHQLEPYTPFTDSDLLPALANGNILERMEKEKQWPLFYLDAVYRCHPKITCLLSDVFYEGRLRPEIGADERSDLVKCLQNGEYPPVLVLRTRGLQMHKETSLFNKIEALTAIKIAELLIQLVFSPSDIAIICMYKAQAEEIASILLNSGIFVGTADSSQGREFRATIICTTRSRVPRKSKKKTCFFSYSKRVLVALSRAKELLIILGETFVLKQMPHWKQILYWAGENRGHFDADDFIRWNEGLVSVGDEQFGSRR